ncbi:hypothetical protein ACOTFF_04850 [Achromobacter xylosoxidans]
MPNNFVNDAEIARRISPTLIAYVKRASKATSICAPSMLNHPAASLVEIVAANLISLAQTGYTGTRKALRFTVANTDTANAFACWSEPSSDWVVITSGLIEILWSESLKLDRLTHALEKEVVADFPIGDMLRSCVGEVDSSSSRFRELIFMSAVAFFVGHEIGHLIDGHAACYEEGGAKDGFNADDEDPQLAKGDSQLRKQALELRADSFGVEYSLRFTINTLFSLCFKPGLPLEELARIQTQVAWIAMLGMSLAIAKIRPVRVDISQQGNFSHPPSAFRALWLNNRATEMMRSWLPLIDEQAMRQIAEHALVQANGLTVLPYDEAQGCFVGSLSREELVRALNQTGIRRLIFESDEVRAYVSALRALDAELHPLLVPHQRRVKLV